MDADYWRRVERVLDMALESEPSQWPTVVAEACHGDDDVRREVESLLGRYATARSYLRSRPVAIAAALLAEARETSVSYEGRRFGAYRVVRELGRGGMSRVFLRNGPTANSSSRSRSSCCDPVSTRTSI